MRFEKRHMSALKRESSPRQIFSLRVETLRRYYSRRHHRDPYVRPRNGNRSFQNTILRVESVILRIRLSFRHRFLVGSRQQFIPRRNQRATLTTFILSS